MKTVRFCMSASDAYALVHAVDRCVFNDRSGIRDIESVPEEERSDLINALLQTDKELLEIHTKLSRDLWAAIRRSL